MLCGWICRLLYATDRYTTTESCIIQCYIRPSAGNRTGLLHGVFVLEYIRMCTMLKQYKYTVILKLVSKVHCLQAIT